MFRKIVVFAADTLEARRALNAAFAMASAFGSELDLVGIAEFPRSMITIAEVEAERSLAEQRFDLVFTEAANRAERSGVRLTTHRLYGRIVERILEFAADNQAELLIFSGLRSSPIDELVFGAAKERIVRRAPCATLIV
jgi:nucleotide-binding universal stress UspA family protein